MLANLKFLFNLGVASFGALLGATQPIDRLGTGLQLAANGQPCNGQTEIIYPKSGQVVDPKQPIEVRYCSGAYFKIRTVSTKILWASTDKAPGLYGYDVGQLTSDDSLGVAGWRATIRKPKGESFQGNKRYIYVLETMTQYGTNDVGFQVSGVEVRLA